METITPEQVFSNSRNLREYLQKLSVYYLFHGSTRDLSALNPSAGGDLGHGVYATTEPDVAFFSATTIKKLGAQRHYDWGKKPWKRQFTIVEGAVETVKSGYLYLIPKSALSTVPHKIESSGKQILFLTTVVPARRIIVKPEMAKLRIKKISLKSMERRNRMKQRIRTARTRIFSLFKRRK